LKSDPEKVTDVQATVDENQDYEKMFHGLAICTNIVGDNNRKAFE